MSVLRELAESIAGLSHTGLGEKSSWFGKQPSRGENIWKTLETNITKFVAGDDAGEELTKSPEVPDPRFGMITPETNLNRMTSLPNLRGQATTPSYAAMPQDTRVFSDANLRYRTVAYESRHMSTAKYDPSSVYAPSHPVHQEYTPEDFGARRYTPSLHMPTPEPSNGGYYSPNMSQQTQKENVESPEEPAVVSGLPPAHEESTRMDAEKTEEVDKNKETKEGMCVESHLLNSSYT